MTVQDLINKLNEIKNKQMIVTIYNHEYGQYYELEEVIIKTLPVNEFYNNSGETVVVLDY